MEKFFYKLKNPITSHPELLEYAKTRHPMYWVKIYSFLVTKVPSEVYAKDAFVSTILERFNGQAIILKMPARAMYNFHIDAERSTSINLLLNNFECSQSFYKVPMLGSNGTADPSLEHIVNIEYSPGQAYVLNVGEQHAVVNTGPERLVFALSIDKPVEYRDVVSFLKENNF